MPQTAQVIIVGAGPVGLTAANLLGLYNIQTIVLEKESTIYNTPRAVGIDDESLRIWQACKLLNNMQPYIAAGSTDSVVFTYYNQNNHPFLNIKQTNNGYGHPKGAVFLQHQVHQVLQIGAQRFKHCALQFNQEALTCNFNNQIWTVTTKNKSYQAPYLLIANGGKSNLRKQLNIPMLGFTYPNQWLIIDAVETQPLHLGVQVWCNSKRPAVYVPLPNNFCRWEFLLHPQERLSHFTNHQTIEALIKQYHPQNKTINIIRKHAYTFNARIAQQYSLHNSCFLLGDAAHVTPPFAAQGLATGLRDAANITFKIAAVIKQQQPSNSLLTYERERKPHQKKMLNLAIQLGKLMMPQNPMQAMLQTQLIKAVQTIPWLANKLMLRGTNITPLYPIRKQHPRSKSGEYCIQPTINTNTLFDTALGDWFALLSFYKTPNNQITEQIKQYCQQYNAHHINLNSYAHGAFLPFFAEWLGTHKLQQRLLLIRPDRFVAADELIA